MRLFMDVDGVLYDWEGYLREQAPYLHIYGMPEELTPEQESALLQVSDDWMYVPKILGEKNWDWVWANQNQIKAYLGPNDYGREHWAALYQLTLSHEVYLVTSRPRDCWWQTYAWVAQQHPQTQLQGIIHADDKVALAQAMLPDVVIDDRPSQLEKYREWVLPMPVGTNPLIYGVRRAWNRELDTGPGIIRWIDGVADLLKEPWA